MVLTSAAMLENEDGKTVLLLDMEPVDWGNKAYACFGNNCLEITVGGLVILQLDDLPMDLFEASMFNGFLEVILYKEGKIPFLNDVPIKNPT